MQSINLPVVLVITLLAAAAGGAATYVFVPNTDPEMKALLQRQVELAEQEVVERDRASQATREFFDSNSEAAKSVRDQFRTENPGPFAPEW